jgi:nitronate monooxygenase
LNAPVRAAARERGDADSFHLWDGEAYPLAARKPAAQVVDDLSRQAHDALQAAAQRLNRLL